LIRVGADILEVVVTTLLESKRLSRLLNIGIWYNLAGKCDRLCQGCSARTNSLKVLIRSVMDQEDRDVEG
jgi:hypothetical protein